MTSLVTYNTIYKMSKYCLECEEEQGEYCYDCEGKCRADETETCEKCEVELRIGCGNKPSDHSIFNGLCDDCRETESESETESEEEEEEEERYCDNKDCPYERYLL